MPKFAQLIIFVVAVLVIKFLRAKTGYFKNQFWSIKPIFSSVFSLIDLILFFAFYFLPFIFYPNLINNLSLLPTLFLIILISFIPIIFRNLLSAFFLSPAKIESIKTRRGYSFKKFLNMVDWIFLLVFLFSIVLTTIINNKDIVEKYSILILITICYRIATLLYGDFFIYSIFLIDEHLNEDDRNATLFSMLTEVIPFIILTASFTPIISQYGAFSSKFLVNFYVFGATFFILIFIFLEYLIGITKFKKLVKTNIDLCIQLLNSYLILVQLISKDNQNDHFVKLRDSIKDHDLRKIESLSFNFIQNDPDYEYKHFKQFFFLHLNKVNNLTPQSENQIEGLSIIKDDLLRQQERVIDFKPPFISWVFSLTSLIITTFLTTASQNLISNLLIVGLK